MPSIACSDDSRATRRVPSLWRTGAALAAVAVVMSVLATTTTAADVTQTYAGTTQQQEHTRMFLLEFPDEIRSLRDTWRNGDFCTWPGVVCYDNATVDVDLSNRGLSGRMPEVDSDIDGSLVTVRSVDLSGNPGIDNDFEDDWKRMSALERLDVSGTSLKGTVPRDWQGMTSLRYLNISGTSACRSLPRWSGMTQLEVVDFSNCNFRGTVSSEFGSLSASVTEAHFEGNNLCGCLPTTVTSGSALWTALTDAQPEIGASNCAVINQCADDSDKCNNVASAEQNTLLFLQEFVDEFDDQLKHVWTGSNYCTWPGVTCAENGTVSVDLSGRGLKGDLPEIDDDIDASKVLVTSIDLSNNPRLDDDFEEDWGRLKRLRFLNLSNTALDGSLPYEWNGMVSLEVRDLNNTIACRSLPDWQLPSLRVADFSQSSFHGSLSASWSAMTALESVNLTGNSFCGCVPDSWKDVDALGSAVAELGPDGVSAADCATSNACSFSMSRCKRNNNNNNNNNGGNDDDDVDDTLKFLREFADELPSLRSEWKGTDYCSWSGVTCNANGTVSVNLSGRGLYGGMPELDDDINRANLNVVSIDLSNNPNIRDGFRNDWAGLRQLEYLDLSNTSLYGNIPDSWNGMVSLREVHIRNTAACRGLPNWNPYAMSSLRVVDFRNNNMAGSLAYSWAAFAGQLESVDFSGNNFCGCVPATWTGSLVSAVGENAPVTWTGCYLLNMCSSSSWQCPAVPNRVPSGGNGGNGGETSTSAPAPASDTLLFLQSLGRALGLGWSGSDFCSFDGVTCAMDSTNSVQLAQVQLGGRGLKSSTLPSVPNSINGARVFVSRIDLSNNANLGGSFPESWAALKQLQYLDLSDTSLRGNIPDSWNGMTSLEEVHIRNTAACRSLPNWRGSSLARLRVLDLSGNANMRGVLTDSLGSVTSLTSADFSGTNLCGCVPDSWYRNSVLTSAAQSAGVPTSNCWANRCTSLSFTCPAKPAAQAPAPAEDPTLRLLRLIAAALTAIFGRRDRDFDAAVARALLPSGQTLEQNWTGDDYCNSWAGVTCDMASGDITLNLSSAGLSGQLPALDNIDGGDVALVSIDFSENPEITGTFPATWGSLKSLRTLRLTNLGIASSLPKEWEGMSALQDLTVSHTSACGELPAWSADSMPALRAVDLSSNKLSGKLPAALGDFTESQLENFTLAGNSAICGCAPDTWVSAALMSGASSANSQLTSTVCAQNSVPCKAQPACVATTGGGSSSADGAARAASALLAWALAGVVAVTMFQVA